MEFNLGRFARSGLKTDPDSKDLSKVMGQAIDELKKSRERREKEKLDDHGETAEVDSALEVSLYLGWRYGVFRFRIGPYPSVL